MLLPVLVISYENPSITRLTYSHKLQVHSNSSHQSRLFYHDNNIIWVNFTKILINRTLSIY